MQTFTGLVKKEENQYASLCIELDVASCGATKEEAIDGLKDAIETYLEYMTSKKKGIAIYRPVPMDGLKYFLFPETKRPGTGHPDSRSKSFRACMRSTTPPSPYSPHHNKP